MPRGTKNASSVGGKISISVPPSLPVQLLTSTPPASTLAQLQQRLGQLEQLEAELLQEQCKAAKLTLKAAKRRLEAAASRCMQQAAKLGLQHLLADEDDEQLDDG